MDNREAARSYRGEHESAIEKMGYTLGYLNPRNPDKATLYMLVMNTEGGFSLSDRSRVRKELPEEWRNPQDGRDYKVKVRCMDMSRVVYRTKT